METTQGKITIKRRSFFGRLFTGIAGGWIAGNLFTHVVRSTAIPKSKEEVQVTINPLAVPRSEKDV
jgi:hypothetical protein